MPHIEVSVLGGPRLAVDGVVAPLAGRQLVLAVRLALTRHVPLPTARLLEAWPPDSSSEGAVRVALTRLRHVLGPASIAHSAEGYTLAPTAHVDADRFEQLLRQAHSTRSTIDDRLRALDEALALWRGPAFDGMERRPWIEYEAVRLDELREQAIDLALELRMASGDDLPIADLAAASARTPEREHRAAMLAVALYRTGRQVEALDVIARTRTRLRDDLGLAPSAGLDELELRILRHDPSLQVAASRSETTARDHRTSESGHHRAAIAFLRVGDVAHALDVAGEAVELARVGGDRLALADALLLRAQAMSLAGQDDPDPVIDEAQVIARAHADGILLARAALLRFGRGVPKDTMQSLVELAEPLELLPREAPQQIDLLCAAAVIVGFSESGPAAHHLLAAAERIHTVLQTPRSEAVWLAARAIVGAIDGADPDELARWTRRSYEVARSTDDPVLLTVAFHARLRTSYLAGDLRAVDETLDSLGLNAAAAMLPFGAARVPICRAANAIARGELAAVPAYVAEAERIGATLRTHAAVGAARSLQLVVALEAGTLHERCEEIRQFAIAVPNSPWVPLAALAGGDDDLARLLAAPPDERAGDAYAVALALSVLAADRWGSAELAAWSGDRIARIEHRVITLGFGTITLGPAATFQGTALLVAGRTSEAVVAFRRGVVDADRSDAALWQAHARLGLAAATLADPDATTDQRADALAMVEMIGASPVAQASARVRREAERLGATAHH